MYVVIEPLQGLVSDLRTGARLANELVRDCILASCFLERQLVQDRPEISFGERDKLTLGGGASSLVKAGGFGFAKVITAKLVGEMFA